MAAIARISSRTIGVSFIMIAGITLAILSLNLRKHPTVPAQHSSWPTLDMIWTTASFGHSLSAKGAILAQHTMGKLG
jgi:hypothetical protein